APGVSEVATTLGEGAAAFALRAGEDFELCACLPAAVIDHAGTPEGVVTAGTDASGLTLTIVGRVLDGAPGLAIDGEPTELTGYEHSL
ncbi:MAG: hypothetical protein WCB67_05620, partial [Solirubrobacteraceae bacterium]